MATFWMNQLSMTCVCMGLAVYHLAGLKIMAGQEVIDHCNSVCNHRKASSNGQHDH